MNVLERMRAILAAEAAAINAVELTDAFEKALDAMYGCKGKIVCTGMGKAGLVARKLAVTMASTGTPSIFMHPGEAAHGDLGVIADGDCVIAFSTSGKTREVIEALELSRHLGSGTIIGVTSHPDSELRRVSDIVLDMGEVTEPCPLGLTPSASTAVMYAISDA
ncbi:MAG: SIS domain-containing protein, partial [Gammaproteobacteria bacterium]